MSVAKQEWQQMNSKYYEYVEHYNAVKLEFNVPFQHKYGYITDKRSGVENYPYQWRKASDILTSTLAAFLFSSHPKAKGIERLI